MSARRSSRKLAHMPIAAAYREWLKCMFSVGLAEEIGDGLGWYLEPALAASPMISSVMRQMSRSPSQIAPTLSGNFQRKAPPSKAATYRSW